ncbi:DUF4283 domain-containing protein [Abeliophyllum distichum]|uniref:DUF4283 domain-containing protein n=1 Tax=Abeliophyllum distichum TaxID=126358 RepID=A0ABD1TXR3_9LAMI
MPGLSLECWNPMALGMITSKICNPISTDNLSYWRCRLSYARILVEFDALVDLIRSVQIQLPNGKQWGQKVSESISKTTKSDGNTTKSSLADPILEPRVAPKLAVETNSLIPVVVDNSMDPYIAEVSGEKQVQLEDNEKELDFILVDKNKKQSTKQNEKLKW